MEPVLRILDAIARGDGRAKQAREPRWIEALMTICWVTETASGFALTAEGQRAHQDLSTQSRASRREAEIAWNRDERRRTLNT